MSIRRSNQLSYTPEKGMVNKAGRSTAGKPSMHIPEVGRPAGREKTTDDLPQTGRGKREIAEFGEGEPLETDLAAIPLPPFADRSEIGALAMEDRLHLMEMPVDAVHGVVLADVLPHVHQAAGRHDQAQFLHHLAAHGGGQRLAMLLAAAGQDQELPFLGPDPHDQKRRLTQDDGPGRRADGSGIAGRGRTGGRHAARYGGTRRG